MRRLFLKNVPLFSKFPILLTVCVIAFSLSHLFTNRGLTSVNSASSGQEAIKVSNSLVDAFTIRSRSVADQGDGN